MTCANCVATVERNLMKLDGVSTVTVNLATERASVEFDPQLVDQDAMLSRIRKTGYDVALGEADLLIQRLGDDNDARRLEKALSALPGVVEAVVNLATERARVRYIPTVVTQTELRRAVHDAGFASPHVEGSLEDGAVYEQIVDAYVVPYVRFLLKYLDIDGNRIWMFKDGILYEANEHGKLEEIKIKQ